MLCILLDLFDISSQSEHILHNLWTATCKKVKMYTERLHFKLCQTELKCEKQNLQQITLKDAQKVIFEKMNNKFSIMFTVLALYCKTANLRNKMKQYGWCGKEKVRVSYTLLPDKKGLNIHNVLLYKYTSLTDFMSSKHGLCLFSLAVKSL